MSAISSGVQADTGREEAMADPLPGTRRATWYARLIMLLAMAIFAGAQPAQAQSILRDAETEALLRDISRPLIVAAGLQPENVKELQGVIAHELGHITGGHILRAQEGATQATGIMILSLLLGAAAIAAG